MHPNERQLLTVVLEARAVPSTLIVSFDCESEV